MAQVQRSPDCGNSPKNARAEEIALALMGVGALPEGALTEAATWDFTGGALTGRDAIHARAIAQCADVITIDQVVTHGRGGAVSGRVVRNGDARLFCHVIRFSSAAARDVAQLVSFEHPGGA